MSTAIEETGLGVFILAAACIIICIGAVSLVRSLRFILSNRYGRLQRTRQIVKISMNRFIVGMLAVIVLFVAWHYQEDARLRYSVKPTDCDHEQSADGRYTASYCYVASRIILRVYASGSHQLLAETTYKNDSRAPIRIYWKDNALRYEDGDDLGTIHLPPTLYERIMAKLP